jgi:hypothetical protein
MPVVEKTFESPYITYAVGGTETIVNGVIDYIKVASGDSTEDCQILTKKYGEAAFTTHLVSSGDSLYGPFIAAKTSGTGDAISVLFYERSKVTTV